MNFSTTLAELFVSSLVQGIGIPKVIVVHVALFFG
jgi:hypothetical protein